LPSRFQPGVILLILAGGVAAVADQSVRLYYQLVEGDPSITLAQRATENELRGEDSVQVWQEARLCAPRSAAIGVNTAFALERVGRRHDAERVLLETERVNRLWLPRWSLASFYLRNRPKEAAWWGRLALERSYARVRPALFSLLDEAGVPSAEWLGWCGGNPEMLAGALEYFSEAAKPDELATATRLLAVLGPGRAPVLWRDSLRAACSRLILAGRGAAAAEAWNALIARRALPFSAISPSNRIGNPGFADPVDGEAFNWRFVPLHGVSRVFDSQSRSVRIRYDGSQPEESQLLAASVWLEPHRSHRFSCSYRLDEGEPVRTGPVWLIGGEVSPPLVSSQGSELARWQTLVLELPQQPEGRIASLLLVLKRKAGFTRAEGGIELRDPKLEALR